IIAAAREKDMGIIIKGPIANAIYEQSHPDENNAKTWYNARKILAPEVIGNMSRVEVALRWLLCDSDVHTAIVGTTNINHFEDNLAATERGRLSDEMLSEIRRQYERVIAEGAE
ncbi:MAG: aldo/keto reductase, partial [Proteobacteria bacterium]|nr:aldo/keto reductase [Pseudomonadota bacterium]